MAEFQNPNQDPDAQKRLIIVFALTFLAILISQQLMERFGPKTPPKTEPTKTEAPAQAGATPPAQPISAAPASSGPNSVTAGQAAKTAKPAPVITRQADTESEIVVENGLYRVTLSNRGGVVKSWILKEHKDSAGKPLDMVHPVAAPAHGYPLALFTYDETLRNKINGELFVTSATGTLSAPATLTYEFADGETTVRKTFSFDHSHVVKVETSVTDKGSPVTAYPAWPAGLGDQDNAPAYAAAQITYQQTDKIERHNAQSGFLWSSGSISNGNTKTGPFYWAGVTDQYFAAIFLPDDPANTALVELHKQVSVLKDPNEKDPAKQKKEVYSVLGAAVGTSGVSRSRLFVGPKELSVLKQVRAFAVDAKGAGEPAGPALEDVADFGFFGIIAKPLFLWLKWTHDHMVPNWGWSIIILTIIINVALFPLRYSSMKAALLQQKIAPEVKAVNYKYREVKSLTDPRQADKQKEIQALMKREGINPMSGCFPMLIQLPFLFAFYSMLMAVNELRHAPWLWVKDLSSTDPNFILPIAIVVTMYAMQKITPMTGMDPAQVKMMQIMMPLMIGAVSFSLPAGLGVYWVAGNIIGFLIQYAMNNSKTARDIREHL
ncbi:MAG: membrane protein insertase YidC, partial [Terriglobales bacterium]